MDILTFVTTPFMENCFVIKDGDEAIVIDPGEATPELLDAIEAISGLKVEKPDLKRAVLRTQLRGLRMEKQQGFTDADYDMPAEVHQQYPQIELPHFNTKEFHGELKQKVNARFDELMVAEGL